MLMTDNRPAHHILHADLDEKLPEGMNLAYDGLELG